MKLISQMTLILFLFISSNLVGQALFAEKENFTRQDTLRGSITAEREWWDLNYYHLDISVNPETRSIKGKNTIRYTILAPYQTLQIDLQPPMKLTRAIQDGEKLQVLSEGMHTL